MYYLKKIYKARRIEIKYILVKQFNVSQHDLENDKIYYLPAKIVLALLCLREADPFPESVTAVLGKNNPDNCNIHVRARYFYLKFYKNKFFIFCYFRYFID